MNKVGRLTLANSVMFVILIYPMQCFWLPKYICSNVDRLLRRLIWQNKSLNNGFHLVKWDFIACLKRFGVREMRSSNIDFLDKYA